MTEPILVTGATGNTGVSVVAGLRDRGDAVRAATRRPDPGDADAVRFDWFDPSTFAAALAGVRAIYLVAPAGVADPAPVVRPFLEQAAAGGVRRVVALSSSAVARGEPLLGEIHALVVDLFSESTVLRPSWFMQNFTADHALAEGIRRSREIVTATGDGRLGFIDAADIAAVAVEALVADRPVGDELVLTGPEALSYGHAAAIISDVLGTPVRHVDVTTAQLADRLTRAGLTGEFAAGLAALDERIRAGEQDLVTTTVYDVTGRRPTSLREFLTVHRARLA
ncbi:NAD(P)H-binding protein [Mycolicibacterium poriferae]|uniref:NAD(P)H-binding protein n=1 Tax=Mycolicibacterium poriferae TaxID=39694 RepID=UPI0024B91FC1|nr:NAD(P)H-binding protein [Mycolicibacterium poriferae]